MFMFICALDQTNLVTIFAVTGEPGVGKTTVVTRVAQTLNQRGLTVGGIISREMTSDNIRTGFEFVDLTTNEKAMLSSTTGNGPRIGKYFVNLDGCRFAAKTLNKAIRNSDVIICDELGPMEFKSEEFIDCVRNMLELDKPVIVVIHKRLHHPLIEQFRNKANILINVDLQNRNKVPDLLLDRLG